MVDATGGSASGRRLVKAAGAFRTISEVSDELDVPQHVLRFWESKFSQIRPMKRGGGRRYYRPEDISLLRTVRDLLYTEGYTIRGVQKLFREGGLKTLARKVERPAAAGLPAKHGIKESGGGGLTSQQRQALEAAVRELAALRDILGKKGD